MVRVVTHHTRRGAAQGGGQKKGHASVSSKSSWQNMFRSWTGLGSKTHHEGEESAFASRHGKRDSDVSQEMMDNLNIMAMPESLGDTSKLIKVETVLKLKSDGTWIPRVMTLTTEILAFTNESDGPIVDYIPLEEVAKVDYSHRQQQNLESFEGMSQEGKSKKSKTKASPHASTHGKSEQAPVERTDLEIITIEGGFNSGRTYVMRAPDPGGCNDWIQKIKQAAAKRDRIAMHKSGFQVSKEWAQRVYNSGRFQSAVVAVIIVNFVVNLVQAQIFPEDDSRQNPTFYWFDMLLTACFTLELMFNAYGHWFWKFARNGWSIFDAIVVAGSLVALSPLERYPGVASLRILRTFRILRLIGRIRALKRIVECLVVSLIPVMNAFLIGLLVTLIYSIIGVALYSGRSPDNFGTFARSLFSLFVLLAFDEWVDDLPAFDDEGNLNYGVVMFLFSFVVIVSWTLLQVVVAVLLDNFIAATMEAKQQRAMEKQRKARAVIHPLDPLLAMLCTSYDTNKDLSLRISQVYQVLDPELKGAVGYSKMRDGFKKLNVNPRMHLSVEDFVLITDGGDKDTVLGLEDFEKMMRANLSAYVQRIVADAVAMNSAGPETTAVLAALKIIMAEGKHANPVQESESGSQFNSLFSSYPAQTPLGGAASRRGGGNPERRLQELEERVDSIKEDMLHGFDRILAKISGHPEPVRMGFHQPHPPTAAHNVIYARRTSTEMMGSPVASTFTRPMPTAPGHVATNGAYVPNAATWRAPLQPLRPNELDSQDERGSARVPDLLSLMAGDDVSLDSKGSRGAGAWGKTDKRRLSKAGSLVDANGVPDLLALAEQVLEDGKDHRAIGERERQRLINDNGSDSGRDGTPNQKKYTLPGGDADEKYASDYEGSGDDDRPVYSLQPGETPVKKRSPVSGSGGSDLMGGLDITRLGANENMNGRASSGSDASGQRHSEVHRRAFLNGEQRESPFAVPAGRPNPNPPILKAERPTLNVQRPNATRDNGDRDLDSASSRTFTDSYTDNGSHSDVTSMSRSQHTSYTGTSYTGTNATSMDYQGGRGNGFGNGYGNGGHSNGVPLHDSYHMTGSDYTGTDTANESLRAPPPRRGGARRMGEA